MNQIADLKHMQIGRVNPFGHAGNADLLSAEQIFRNGHLLGQQVFHLAPRRPSASLTSHLAHRPEELNCADAAENDSHPQKQKLHPY